MNIKTLSIVLGIIATITSAGIGYGVLKTEAKDAKKQTEKNEKKIEKHDDQIQELEKYSIKQEMLHQETLRMLKNLKAEIKEN